MFWNKKETVLRKRDLGMVTLAGRLNAHQRRSRLVDECRQDGIDGLASNCRHRFPEIGGARVGISVALQISVDSLPESVFPNIAFQHSQDGCSFVIGNAVEQAFNLRRSLRHTSADANG